MIKRRLLAYLTFVVSITVSFRVIFGAYRLMNGWDSASGHSAIRQIQDFLGLLLIRFLVVLVLASIVSLIPFVFWMFVLSKTKAYSLWSFIIWGSTLGAILSPFFASIPSAGFLVNEDINTYAMHQFMVFLPILLVCGAISGIACRTVLIRKDHL